ncbi:hypothetical protein CPB86DRAFT_497844 [Serendipita vermifera]|nr:hypothetical protein CPB86DRAFT_497844 [Serendipita vermifera]
MPSRKKATEEGATPAEPERRSTRIREMPAKPAPDPATTAAAKTKKSVKKTDPELAEWKPTKKPAAKKRKKADVEGEENEAGDAEEAKEEEKPKKKVRRSPFHALSTRVNACCGGAMGWVLTTPTLCVLCRQRPRLNPPRQSQPRRLKQRRRHQNLKRLKRLQKPRKQRKRLLR